MEQVDYSNYDIGDFAADEHFVEWVLRPDWESDNFWNQWQEQHPGAAKRLHEARLLVLLMHSRKIRLPEEDKQDLWQKIQSQTTEKPAVAKRGQTRRFIVYATAASVALLVAVLAFVNRGEQHMIIAKNPAGKTSIVYLQDGTKVWLNADSKLEYLSSFGDETTRAVALEGEAFFDVAEDKNKPFIVNTRDAHVKVLGTAFNIKAFPGDERNETTLLRGRVEVTTAADSKPIVLTKNQQAIVNNSTHSISMREVEAGEVAAWREGVLIFDNTPFSEVALSLERKYAIDITVEDQESLHCHFSGIVRDEPIVKVLELLRTTSKITYEIDGTNVRLKGSLCDH